MQACSFSDKNCQMPPRPSSYGSWSNNYLCNQCLSPLMLWVRISIRARCRTLCDKVCQWLVAGWWFSPRPPVSSTNKTDHHNITEILLKVALKTIKQTIKHQMASGYSLKEDQMRNLCRGFHINHWYCTCSFGWEIFNISTNQIQGYGI